MSGIPSLATQLLYELWFLAIGLEEISASSTVSSPEINR
jgi:hypothetical protein